MMLNPRNESSSAFTKAPIEFDEAVIALFTDHFHEESEKGHFSSSTFIYPHEIIIRIGYLEKNSISQVNFLLSTDFNSQESDVIETVDLMLLGIRDVFQNYFARPLREELPYFWSPLRETHNAFYYKYDATNYSLEEQANQLLGESVEADDLIVGNMDEESEEIKNIIDSLSHKRPTFQ